SAPSALSALKGLGVDEIRRLHVRSEEDQDRQGPAGEDRALFEDRRLLLARGVREPRPRKGAGQARGRRHGRGDQEEAAGARLHLVSAVNALLRPAFDVLLAPFRSLPPIVGLLVMSLVAAVGMLLVFKKTSNQKKLEA